jgi:hypothetical protein
MRVETVRPTGPGTWVLGLVGTQSERFRNVTITTEELKLIRIDEASYRYNGESTLKLSGVVFPLRVPVVSVRVKSLLLSVV